MARCAKIATALLCGVAALRRTTKRDCYSQYDGQPLLQFTSSSEEEMKAMMGKLEDLQCTSLADDGDKEMMAICEADRAAGLVKLYAGKAVVLLNDAGAFYRNSSGVAHQYVEGTGPGVLNTFYNDWRDSDSRTAQVNAAVSGSGGACTLEQVGTSVEGRPIMAVRITGQGWQSGMPRVVLNFQLHAREWIAGMSGVYAVEQACQNARGGAYAGVEIVMIPMNNPDGFLYTETSSRFHRKNMRVNSGSSCRGVDLNRNYDPAWGGASSSPCSDTFHGSSAFSEPETQALKSVLDEAPVNIHLDVHAFSELILCPWSYTYTPHARRSEIDVPGRLMQEAIRSVHGKTYQYGGSELLYTAAGVAPDYSTSQGAFGYTYELRPSSGGMNGFAPPASEILPTAEECWAGIAAAIDWATNYVPPAPTPAPPPGSWQLTGTGCEMNGNCIQSKNHPSNYGNSESCSVALHGDIPLRVDAFATESGYDFLTVGGSRYSGSSGPSNGSYSGTITWESDYSVTQSGWKLCRTD